MSTKKNRSDVEAAVMNDAEQWHYRARARSSMLDCSCSNTHAPCAHCADLMQREVIIVALVERNKRNRVFAQQKEVS